MKINRNVNGVKMEFELTDDELCNAYIEQQHIFDIMDCENMIVCLNDDEIIDCYGVTREQYLSLLDEMADVLRKNIDKYEMSWDYARDDAIRTVTERGKI